jgi:hypothetical protein
MMYYIHRYEHIDMMMGMHPPTRPVQDKCVYLSATVKDLEEQVLVIQAIKDAFRQAGWEGDGELTTIWLPPFACPVEDTHGEWLFHVKQSNNGTSFIAAMFDLQDHFPDANIEIIGDVSA